MTDDKRDTSRNSTTSYSWQRPDLQRRGSSRLYAAGSARWPFNHAGDKHRCAPQQQAQSDSGGSQMVKQDKPFPELRPKHDMSQIRQRFNQKWREEYRQAERRGDIRVNALTRDDVISPDRGLER